MGLTVVAVLPEMPGMAPVLPKALDPFAIKPPAGLTYQWVRTALLGEPDPANVAARVENGWTFVAPSIHPDAPTATLDISIENGGLVLMQKPTSEVMAQLAKDHAAAKAAWAAQDIYIPEPLMETEPT